MKILIDMNLSPDCVAVFERYNISNEITTLPE
jgi:predicted nuclease of predicted toxin-antitoxin system